MPWYNPLAQPNDPVTPVAVIPYSEPWRNRVEHWSQLTTFWEFLEQGDRELYENYWYGLSLTADALIKKGNRFYEALAPEGSRVDVLDDYYEIQIGPMFARPVTLDPTVKESGHLINPLEKVLIEPQYDDTTPVYRDMIRITAADYHKIRDIGIGIYLVAQSRNSEIEDRYFTVFNLLASSESQGSPAYGEIDSSMNDESVAVNPNDSNDVGIIGLEGLYAPGHVSYVDVSEATISFVQSGTNGTDPTTVTWDDTAGAETLVIEVKTTAADQIAEIIAAAPTGTPWATLTDKGGLKRAAPVFSGIQIKEFDDLTAYKAAEVDSGRHIPPTGDAWVWFSGYSSSNGTVGNAAHGEYVDSISKYEYVIIVDGDLSYLGNDSFSVYLTTARAYNVHTYVSELPELQTMVTPGIAPEFVVGDDYMFDNNIVEFNRDIFTGELIEDGDYLYCPKTPIIEHYLFELYGTMVNLGNWQEFNYNNISGKAGVNSLLKSIQNSSNRIDYERALNIYYGIPVSPEQSKVIGLYESYGYEITSISTNQITVKLQTVPFAEELSDFIQPGGRFFIEGKTDVVIDTIDDRALGTITLEDASELVVGDEVHLRLWNKYHVTNFIKEGDVVSSDPAYIDISSPDGHLAIAHLIDVIHNTTDGDKYPEIIVYGTDGLDVNYDGIYHIKTVGVGPEDHLVRLGLYKASDFENPVYNDFIGTTTNDVTTGFVHIPWPTHKFLYLLLNGERYFKAYLDSPIDTIYEEEDRLEKYQVIARNVSVLKKTMFPSWYQFDYFRKYHGLNYESDMLELVKIVPGAVFGDYFPNRYYSI